MIELLRKYKESMRPRIGITTSYNDGRQNIDHHYLDAIEQAGGLPLIVPMLHSDEATQEFASLLDGLVMTGGPGITRGLQGTLPDDLPPVDSLRDSSDERIFCAFSQRPVLGICYGMQFINALCGGTIHGDLSAGIEGAINHSTSRGAQPHLIRIQPDTRLYRILGQVALEVNTYHIQALASIGDGLRVSATAPDGVIEGIESLDGRMLGVQFHPERMTDVMQPLFNDFVDRCRI
jgi:putative glutamine amidotransferase